MIQTGRQFKLFKFPYVIVSFDILKSHEDNHNMELKKSVNLDLEQSESGKQI